MALTGLMARTGKDTAHGQNEGLLIITHNAAQAIAQRLDGLKHTVFQSLVIRGQHGSYLQHQTELQFPDDIQSRVALFGLEGINGQEEAMLTEVRCTLS